MKKNDISIFIATHKDFNPPKNKIYRPLQVGADGKRDLNFLKDNIDENISSKNSNYCELTGIYWIWKNIKADIVGLVHYRRYFYKDKSINDTNNILDKDDINKLMKIYDVIVPKKVKILSGNVKQLYAKKHNVQDYNKCREIISEKYPKYLHSFDKISNQRYLYPYNMTIMKKKYFDEYCKWLFDILFELEKRVDISDYDDYNKRIFGFLSERLFNVWLDYNKKLKVKEIIVYNTEDNVLKQRSINLVKDILVRG